MRFKWVYWECMFVGFRSFSLHSFLSHLSFYVCDCVCTRIDSFIIWKMFWLIGFGCCLSICVMLPLMFRIKWQNRPLTNEWLNSLGFGLLFIYTYIFYLSLGLSLDFLFTFQKFPSLCVNLSCILCVFEIRAWFTLSGTFFGLLLVT